VVRRTDGVPVLPTRYAIAKLSIPISISAPLEMSSHPMRTSLTLRIFKWNSKNYSSERKDAKRCNLLHGGPSAVCGDDCAGDVARLWRGQERYDFGDLVSLRGAIEQGGFPKVFGPLRCRSVR